MEPIDAFKLDLVQPLEVPQAPRVLHVEEEQGTFEDVLHQWISKTDETLRTSDKTVQSLVDGTLEHPHDAMIKLEQAQLALEFTVQLRNKAVDAYNEIMRMQI